MLCEQARTYFECDEGGIPRTHVPDVANLSKEGRMAALRRMLMGFLEHGWYGSFCLEVVNQHKETAVIQPPVYALVKGADGLTYLVPMLPQTSSTEKEDYLLNYASNL